MKEKIKYKFELKSIINVFIEASSKGEAQKQIFRELDNGDLDIQLREECLVDEGYGIEKVEKIK